MCFILNQETLLFLFKQENTNWDRIRFNEYNSYIVSEIKELR